MNIETLTLLKWGYRIIYIISVVSIVRIWIKDSESKSYKWFYAQLIILYIASERLFRFIELTPELIEIINEENSALPFTSVGLYWGVSMMFMLAGIRGLGKKQRN